MSILQPGALVVSCQAAPGNPFFSPELMALMARAAEAGFWSPEVWRCQL